VIDPKRLDELQARLREIFAHSPAQDLERNLKAALSALFARLDLVTREEFDVQREVLLRTREKLERLEHRLAELEGGGPGAGGIAADQGAPPLQPD
jgi:BMFP domain-containing protein YqiC